MQHSQSMQLGPHSHYGAQHQQHQAGAPQHAMMPNGHENVSAAAMHSAMYGQFQHQQQTAAAAAASNPNASVNSMSHPAATAHNFQPQQQNHAPGANASAAPPVPAEPASQHAQQQHYPYQNRSTAAAVPANVAVSVSGGQVTNNDSAAAESNDAASDVSSNAAPAASTNSSSGVSQQPVNTQKPARKIVIKDSNSKEELDVRKMAVS